MSDVLMGCPKNYYEHVHWLSVKNMNPQCKKYTLLKNKFDM